MGYAPNYAGRYSDMQVAAADRFELVLLLYKAAIKEAKIAIVGFQADDIEARVNHLNKASAIIGELRAALDFEKGGQIAQSLAGLYEYMNRRLAEANLRKQPAAVDEVIRLLESLLSAWEEALSRTAGAEGSGMNGAVQTIPAERLGADSYSRPPGISVSF